MSSPVASGRWTSRTTTSGRTVPTATTASAAVVAVQTDSSSPRNARWNACRMAGSSSMTNRLGIRHLPRPASGCGNWAPPPGRLVASSVPP